VLASLQPEVRQLVTGSSEGPLGMAGEGRTDAQPMPLPRPPTEDGFEVPVPLAAVAILLVTTAIVLVLGHGHTVELAFVAAIWLTGAALAVVRRRRSR